MVLDEVSGVGLLVCMVVQVTIAAMILLFVYCATVLMLVVVFSSQGPTSLVEDGARFHAGPGVVFNGTTSGLVYGWFSVQQHARVWQRVFMRSTAAKKRFVELQRGSGESLPLYGLFVWLLVAPTNASSINRYPAGIVESLHLVARSEAALP